MEKILCVDDDSSLLCLYQEELSEERYEVILAKDGQEALSKFMEEKPQVVVMEIRIPVMDGIETLNAMLGKNRQTQVILNTTYPQYKQNFMTWGALAYLIKSSDSTELKQINPGGHTKAEKVLITVMVKVTCGPLFLLPVEDENSFEKR